jgi:hypothetical protein
VVKERELGLVKDFGASLEVATQEISELEDTTDADLQSALSYKRERLERLNKLRRAGETILSALVAGDAVDPTQLIVDPD